MEAVQVERIIFLFGANNSIWRRQKSAFSSWDSSSQTAQMLQKRCFSWTWVCVARQGSIYRQRCSKTPRGRWQRRLTLGEISLKRVGFGNPYLHFPSITFFISHKAQAELKRTSQGDKKYTFSLGKSELISSPASLSVSLAISHACRARLLTSQLSAFQSWICGINLLISIYIYQYIGIEQSPGGFQTILGDSLLAPLPFSIPKLTQ